jgi:cell division protein FtsL
MLRRAFLILLLLVILALIHLIIYVQNVGIQYNIDDLAKQLDLVRSENRSLNSIVARFESLGRIEKIAVERLKMVKPGMIYYLHLK